VGTPDEARAATTEETKAIVIVPPIPKVSILSFVRRRDDDTPAFVLMSGPLPEPTVCKLYQNGIEGVLEWPSDRTALTRTMLRLTAPSDFAWGRTKSGAEVALEETARTHLDADAVPFGAQLTVDAVGRIIVLKGQVDALWKLELAREVVASIAGVEDVVAGGVEITGQGRSDRAVAEAIRQVLRHSSAVESSTLAVAVRSGCVTLTGTVKSKDEAARALDLIRQVRGVRGVDDYLVVSPVAKQQDRVRARRVRHVVQTRYPSAPVDVSVFGGVAVLTGRVPRAALRDQIKRLVNGQDGIQRVVDKLRVSGRAPRQR
jgi:osmotically-inducible protein OsmY